MVPRRRSSPHRRRAAGAALALTLALVSGCARVPAGPAAWPSLGFDLPWQAPPAPLEPAPSYAFFEAPAPGDAWTPAIAAWRVRERAALRAGLIAPFPAPAALPPVSAGPAARSGAGSSYALGDQYDAFLAGRRRALAHDVLRWVQSVARERFVEDGPVDRWPTFLEVRHAAGDDCDGLELLSYHALRQLGFPPDQVYRAILRRLETTEHHMVTFWFEDPEDPWVLDPTDTITSRLRRLSALDGWVPLKLFSEAGEFSVTRLPDEIDAAPERASDVGAGQAAAAAE